VTIKSKDLNMDIYMLLLRNMALEADLSRFWASYIPVLDIVEAASSSSEQGGLHDKVEVLLHGLDVMPGWEVRVTDKGKWYDGLLVSEVRILYGEGMHLALKPKYVETGDCEVFWDCAERRQDVRRFASSMPTDDMFLYFVPPIHAEWKKDDKHHLPDYRTLKSDTGLLEVTLEDGRGSFISHKRAEFIKADMAKPMLEVGENGIPRIRQQPLARLVGVKLGYPEMDVTMSDDEMGALWDEMFLGYTCIKFISFSGKELGSGEIDRFMQHIGIDYK
jgi:hypothetical protein